MTPQSPSGPSTPTSSSAIAELPEFIALAREKGLDPRPVILRVQTDLLLAAPERSPDMLDSFRRLALELVPLIEDETLAQIAGKLARLPDLPHEVGAALIARQGLVAATFVAQAPHLPPEAALVLADRGDILCARALAGRADCDETVLLRLIDRNDTLVDAAMAATGPRPLPGRVIDILLARAPGRAALCEALVGRQEVSVEEGARLLPWLQPVERAVLIGRASTRTGGANPPPVSPDPADERDIETLVLLARRREEALFRSEFARLCALPDTAADTIAQDEGGELLVLGLVAIGCFPEEIAAIVLSRQPAIAHDVRRVFGLVDLARDLRRDVALRLVTAAFTPEAARPARGAVLASQFAPEARPGLRAVLRPVRQKPAAALGDLRDLSDTRETG